MVEENNGEDQSAGENVFNLSDEKLFTVEAVTNTQNDRILATWSDAVPQSVRIYFAEWNPPE